MTPQAYAIPGLIIGAKDPFLVAANIFNVSVNDIYSKSRKREIVSARMMLFNYYKESKANYTLEKIGQLIGNKGHTTVIHGLKTFNNLIETDKDYRAKFNEFKRMMG